MKLVNKNSRIRTYIEINVNKYIDSTDHYYFDIKWINKKNNLESKSVTILKPELEDWLNSLYQNGW